MDLALSQLHSDFPALPYTSHSPCPALVLPNYKIISSNEAKLTSKPAFCGLRDAKKTPLGLEAQLYNIHSPHYTFSLMPEIPPFINIFNLKNIF